MSENPTENFENTMYNFPTADLPKRYGVSKATVYSWLGALRIKPQRVEGTSGSSYITADQFNLLERLYTHCQAKGKIRDFVNACIESGEISSISLSAEDVGSIQPEESEAMVVSQAQYEEPFETGEVEFAAPPKDAIARLQAQKEIRVSEEDLQEANSRGQYRAAAKIIAEETLVRVYEATEEFTIPGLKEQVEQHRQNCRQSRPSQGIANNLNDFLSRKLQAAGMSGLTAPPSFNTSQSPTSSSAPDNA